MPAILGQLPQWLQDVFLVMVILAFFSCGTAVQGAGARLAYSYARDGAVPASAWVRRISPRFHTPANALIVGDLPWMSYHVSVEDTVRNAATLIRAGAVSVSRLILYTDGHGAT